jgi:hypothetical protein
VSFCVVTLYLVTTGLDPVVYGDERISMDCRIKSGNDELTGLFVHQTQHSEILSRQRRPPNVTGAMNNPRHPQDQRLLEARRHDLHADRQSVLRQARRRGRRR